MPTDELGWLADLLVAADVMKVHRYGFDLTDPVAFEIEVSMIAEALRRCEQWGWPSDRLDSEQYPLYMAISQVAIEKIVALTERIRQLEGHGSQPWGGTMERPEISRDNPRVNALASMWDEWVHEHHLEMKARIPRVSPWSSIQYWGCLFADYILSKDPVTIEMLTKAAAKRLEERLANEAER